jgi:hypothetical protein
VIRVSTHAEAELLAVPLASSGIALEITAPLAALDTFHAHMGQALGGLTNDYRSQAAQAGERLRKADLLAFFRVAKAFYAEELWWTYGDEVFCEMVFEHEQRPVKTLYGILMGSMGQEFGLALFYALDDLQQFYNLSVQHLDVITDRPEENMAAQGDLAQLQREAEVMAQLLDVPTISLTYTPQEEVPAPLLQEARQLKLPLANDLAFPLVMRTGQRGMQGATATELAEVFSALRALLDWNARLRPVGDADEIDTTITTTLPAVAGFAPALTAHTTLRLNPYVPAEEEGEEDEDAFLPDPDIEALFGTLFTEPVKRKAKSHSKKKTGTRSAGKSTKAKKAQGKKVRPAPPQSPKHDPEV